MRRILVIAFVVFALSTIALAFEDAEPMHLKAKNFSLQPIEEDYRIVEALDILEEMEDTARPVLEPFLGHEPMQMGITWYDMQHNSTVGRNVVLDDDGGIHVAWMRSPNALISQRQIYYNYVNPDGSPFTGYEGVGMRCDYALYKSGYCTIDAIGCTPFVGYHEMQTSTDDPAPQVSWDAAALESGCAIHGGFSDSDPAPPHVYFPGCPETDVLNIWPVVSISDLDNDIHIVTSSSYADTICGSGVEALNYCVYYHGEISTSGSSDITWDNGVILHDVAGVTPDIATANSRDEVSIAFYKVEDYECTWVDASNVILCTSSDDGASWDTTYITHNSPDYHDDPFDTFYYAVTWVAVDSITGDTTYTPGIDTFVCYTRPSGGLNVFYDNEDYVHVIWTEAIYPNTDSCTGNTALSQAKSELKHWTNRDPDVEGNVLSTYPMRNGQWPGGDATSNVRYFFNSFSPSAGVADDGTIYCLWQNYYAELWWTFLLPDGDTSTVYYDRSSHGFANHELFMSYSTDNGNNWIGPVDISNTYTPLCDVGDCRSELDASIAKDIDDKVHIFWIDDRDAGIGINDLGSNTENPVYYLGLPTEDIRAAADEWDDADNYFIRDYPEAISEKPVENIMPESFNLNSNYPNPFNVSTTFTFDIKEAGSYALEVYDAQGKLVRTLMNTNVPQGNFTAYWDGRDMEGNVMTSGSYLYRLRDSKGNAVSRKMSLVK